MRRTRLLVVALMLAGPPAAHAAPQVARTLTGCCNFGWVTAGLVDINGDGRRDIIVGAPASGSVFVYSSATGALLHTFTLPQSDLGFAVADAGDVDRDGIHDILAGSSTFNNGAGAARVYSGASGAVLYSLSGDAPGQFLGAAVTGVGDVDRDGHDDFAISAQGQPAAVTVYSGATGASMRTFTGSAGSRFGAGVARVDDFDGDGMDELLIGAPTDGPGRAYLHALASGARLLTLTADRAGGSFGEFFVFNAGDVDADGRGDWYVGAYAENNNNGAVYVYSGATGARLRKLEGVAAEGLGPGRGAGDVDGDGHADLIVGSYLYSAGGVNQGGRMTVFSGRDASVLSRLDGTRVGGQSGFDAIALGDLDGDRRTDFAVAGAPANSVDIVLGDVDRPAGAAIEFGMTGAWSDPARDGQGLTIEVLPSRQQLFVAWFAFAPLPGQTTVQQQRWLTAQGGYAGAVADLPVFLTNGGAFNTAGGVTTTPVGTLRLEFASCTEATGTYSLDVAAITGVGAAGAQVASGTMALQRLTPVVQCNDASVPR